MLSWWCKVTRESVGGGGGGINVKNPNWWGILFNQWLGVVGVYTYCYLFAVAHCQLIHLPVVLLWLVSWWILSWNLVFPHIATPGRLVDHLENTKGFSLRSLKYLVSTLSRAKGQHFSQMITKIQSPTSDWVKWLKISLPQTSIDNGDGNSPSTGFAWSWNLKFEFQAWKSHGV